jgi:hypothetical protein
MLVGQLYAPLKGAGRIPQNGPDQHKVALRLP